MTIVHDRNGKFQSVAIFIDAKTLMVPYHAEDSWYRGTQLTTCIKRSQRHYYSLYEVTHVHDDDKEEVYTKHVKDIHAVKQRVRVQSPIYNYETIVKAWLWRENGTYRLKLGLKADPRLNGCPVFIVRPKSRVPQQHEEEEVESEDDEEGGGGKLEETVEEDGEEEEEEVLLGMALSLSWQGKVECVPIDLISKTNPVAYSRIMPTIMLTPERGTVDGKQRSYHPSKGIVHAPFRILDKYAEKAKNCYIPCEKGELYMSGSHPPPFRPLPFQAFIEWGPFAFRQNLYGLVECVSEIYTEDMLLEELRDEIHLVCPNRVIWKINDTEIRTLDELERYLTTHPMKENFIHWADRRRAQRVRIWELSHLGGRQISPYASIWYEEEEEGATKQEKEEEAKQEEDTRSCLDECESDALTFHP